MGHPKFTIKKSTDDQYYFNLTAGNAEIVLTSERYTSRSGAERGVSSVKENAPLDQRYDRRPSGKQYYFVLKAANGEIIGTSEMYSSQSARESGIDAVKRSAAVAETE